MRWEHLRASQQDPELAREVELASRGRPCVTASHDAEEEHVILDEKLRALGD